jgi:hypothetical protein
MNEIRIEDEAEIVAQGSGDSAFTLGPRSLSLTTEELEALREFLTCAVTRTRKSSDFSRRCLVPS